jgi:hypothetical protein
MLEAGQCAIIGHAGQNFEKHSTDDTRLSHDVNGESSQTRSPDQSGQDFLYAGMPVTQCRARGASHRKSDTHITSLYSNATCSDACFPSPSHRRRPALTNGRIKE